MLAGVGLPIAPWTARNYYTFETFVPITTNSAINLYMGNNPEATGGFHWKLPDRAQELWNLPDDDSSHEREIYLLSKQEAVDYMLSHPGRTIALWPQKLWSLWEPGPAAGSSSAENLYRFYRTGVHWGPYLILSCWGIWLLRRDRLVQLVCGVALCGSLVHLLTYGAIRYRAPYEFLFALPATGALLYLISKVRLQFSNRSIGKISFRFQTRERAEVTFSRTETSAG
jgi:hypothetical protein